jgi:deoxyribodipyrimidine photo-lyase
MLTLQKIGFKSTDFEFPAMDLKAKTLKNYAETRDFPALDHGTTRLGIHLRFGTLSVRELGREGLKFSPVWLSELAWRDFFMQVLFHFPDVEKRSFRPDYEKIAWRKSKEDFERWCQGMTGYPLVDAGMRELNATGHMHNRVRMVAASFLTKHLLIHWYAGERYFARKLLDYDLAANNGNWQWAAGTGCDAAPYFRIFNPQAQLERFDKKSEYVRKWVPEIGTSRYPAPMVEHVFARQRALQAFQAALKKV